MPSTPESKLIEQIHAAARPLMIAVTGGGSGAISALLQVPGASATVLEAVVPYAATSLTDWLGGTPDQFCSERTARAMAMAAFERARALSAADPSTLRGIGVTASVASNRPKRGPHRIHIAWESAETTAVTSCDLGKGARSRQEEETIATRLVLNAVAEAAGVDDRLTIAADDVKPQREQHAPLAWTELLLGTRSHVLVAKVSQPGNETPKVLFPGAFNPIHSAHRRMAQLAAEMLGRPVTFELSITNVDKAPLDFIEIADRLTQFRDDRVLLTRAPRFIEKAAIAPGCTFVVGVDTIVRIGDAKYYADGESERDAAIRALADVGCRFLVFGRQFEGSFQNASTTGVLPALRSLCEEVSESKFREDISSTELRGENSKG